MIERTIPARVLILTAILVLPNSTVKAEKKVFRLGIIGLDTSHVTAFTRFINDGQNDRGCKVVAAYRGGSPDIVSSADRVEGYTKQIREQFDVEIVQTIEELCEKVDGVLLESVDGRVHLEQIRPVIAAKKPVFVDKPIAGNLADVIEIFRLAKENDVPCWSSSSLRYCPGIVGMRNNEDVGEVLGCDAFSPCYLEEHHPDLYWYGVHGVEILYTIMGPGCQRVRRVQTKDSELVVGVWENGRIGTFRGLRSGKKDYGAVVYGTKGIAQSGKYTGYGPLVEEIIEFFKTGEPPVSAEETIEIFAFMSAADESKTKGGTAVRIDSVIEKAKKQSKKPRVEFVEGNKKIDVIIGGKVLTSYLYGGQTYEKLGDNERNRGFLAKPVLYPVYTPSGIIVNRGYPLVKVDGEIQDHPHHVGVFFTYDEVNNDGFWNNTFSPPQIKHIQTTQMISGPGKGQLSTVMHWTGKTGKVLLEEKRDMVFYAGKDEYIIDFNINLTAQDTKVIFSDTKEGMFAIRLADWLRENSSSRDNGTGKYLSSNGDETEKNVWGKRARWVRLQGEKDGKTIGVAIFNHPMSVNYPTYWHARGYGLFAANPLGQLAFQQGHKLDNPRAFNLTLKPGESALFKFRMVIYEGARTNEQLEQQFEHFTK